MPRISIIITAILLFPTFTNAQSSSACHEAPVVFVGRAEPAVTFHISGEPAIERARRDLIRIEKEVEEERAALDPRARLEREREFVMRIYAARQEVSRRQVMYPPPHDLTFFPMMVEQSFRGVTESKVMVVDLPRIPLRLAPDQRYLIIGFSSKNMLPPFPEMADANLIDSYIETIRATPIAQAQREVEFL